MPEVDPASVKIRPAASAIILRDTPRGLEVFMVVRHHQIDFASGAIVFPGGSVDPQDDQLDVAVPTTHPTQAPTSKFWLACIRETFEEAGILLARTSGQRRLIEAKDAAAIERKHRAAILDGSRKFADMLIQENLEPATDLMVHFAHWITPIGPPRRFDTHFFLVAAPIQQAGLHDGREAVDGIWIRPEEAIADADAGRRVMLPPTRLNLLKLSWDQTVRDAVARAQSSKVVTVLPKVVKGDFGRTLLLPIEAGYGMAEYKVSGH
ncbi:MAG: NUDIX domain-containing protein [Rhodospirillales bacterium]|nr:NUDIX domain-containing protein [Rhodospirillales bacterium]